MEIQYTIVLIMGDYALLRTSDGIENRVALALLPDDISEGAALLYKDFEYILMSSL